ncbi:MAG: hypothetical protein JSS93_04110 [Bacteroidetes bacterium]|nr:hypothetical protein [Bacteroidota bacterium]MBS1981681.1 hypothetical protein [Bacteroidota bacterium]
MGVFENFRLLKEDMQKQGWVVDAFSFSYKMIDYVVLIKLYLENEIKPEYALLKTEFLKGENFEVSLEMPANVNGFIVEAKTLRQFFGIEYSKNLGDIFQQFNKYFSGFIPKQFNLTKPDFLIKPVLISLSKNDSEDPDKKYCFKVRRNPKNEFRTLFNDNKTRILRPSLYSKFANEKTISFCYSKDASDQKTDQQIIFNFSKRT